MIVMKEVHHAKDGWREARNSVMLGFSLQGDNNEKKDNNNHNDSSMARTVSLPLAIAMELIKLCDRYIFFAHRYKNQDGNKQLFRRFKDGNGEIYDLEFIVHPRTNVELQRFGFVLVL